MNDIELPILESLYDSQGRSDALITLLVELCHALIGALIALFLSLGCTALAYLQQVAYRADQPAIVFDEEVVARSEPNPRSQEAFRLHEGTKVQMLDSLDSWQKVELADGQTGWMPRKSLKLLKDF